MWCTVLWLCCARCLTVSLWNLPLPFPTSCQVLWAQVPQGPAPAPLPPGPSSGSQLLSLRLAPPFVQLDAPASDPLFASAFGSLFRYPVSASAFVMSGPLAQYVSSKEDSPVADPRPINLLLASLVWRAISPVIKRRSIPLRSPPSAWWTLPMMQMLSSRSGGLRCSGHGAGPHAKGGSSLLAPFNLPQVPPIASFPSRPCTPLLVGLPQLRGPKPTAVVGPVPPDAPFVTRRRLCIDLAASSRPGPAHHRVLSLPGQGPSHRTGVYHYQLLEASRTAFHLCLESCQVRPKARFLTAYTRPL